MATIVGIPAPTDSYDHENCNKSNLTSIRSLIAAFDASMDSLHDSINSQISKLDDISRRAKHCEQDWNTMKDDSNTCTSTHANDSTSNSDGDKIQNDDDSGLESILIMNVPSAYEDVIQETQNIATYGHSIESALTKAREEANSAIRSILREEAMTFETTAKPSDAWLDRGSGFDQKNACQAALRMHSVPSLMLSAHNSIQMASHSGERGKNIDGTHTVIREEVEYYKEGIMHLREINQSQTQIQNAPTPDDDMSLANQSYMSEQTGRGTLYTNYSEGTASHRRRQRKIAASMRRKKSSGMMAGHMDGGDGRGSGNGALQRNGNGGGMHMHGRSASSSRQHLMSGSLPYVCEMIHDTHQLGSIRGSHVFPQVENVCDLFIHGTDEMAYSVGQVSRGEDTSSAQGDGENRARASRRKKSHGDVARMSRKSSSELFQLAEDEPLSIE
jgi:hypothetical protein